MEPYNEYSLETIKNLIEAGKKIKAEGYTECEIASFEKGYNTAQYRFIRIGFLSPDFQVGEIKEYFRIGEPRLEYGNCYYPSFNFSDDRREEGLSVITNDWLESFKGLFFGSGDDEIRARGIYKIKGFELPLKGGDDEPLIIPMDYAEKTGIKTREELIKTLKERR